MKIITSFIIFCLALLNAQAQNNPPVALDDTDTTYSGIEVAINVKSNDTDPDGGFLFIDTVIDDATINGVFTFDFTKIYYTPDIDFVGVDTIIYVIRDLTDLYDTAKVIINVLDKLYGPYQFLDINNIKALFNPFGNHFSNLSYGTSFEVPKGSGMNTMFVSDIWIGGFDSNDSLHLAAQRYGNADFWAGPVMDSVQYSPEQDSIWNHLWKVNKCEIDSHIAHWDEPGYVAPLVILDWPAHGDVSLGQAYNLAPFFDRAGNNSYDPYDGDYPLIKGDQAIYIIRNDDRNIHTESSGAKLKIEIHELAYAFNCPADSALWNTIFINSKIINRSNNTYDSTYIGVFGDMDIGCYTDDYIGSDVGRGSFFGYNGDALDENCAGNNGYGTNPPAQSITFLKGPLMDTDGLDNPDGGCDASVNGTGFGDGVIDNESWGMTAFMPFSSPGEPSTAMNYYNIMKAIWTDNTKMVYGGSGHISGCTSCEQAKFWAPGSMTFPVETDPCYWGIGGITPGDLVPWTEQNAGNAPNDRRGVGSTGPFTFSPGDTAEIELALVFGRDYVDTINPAWSSVVVMKERIDSIRNYFENIQLVPCGGSPCSNVVYTGIKKQEMQDIKYASIEIYPNPFFDYTTIEAFVPQEINSAEIVVYNILGLVIKKYSLKKGENKISVYAGDIVNGIYFYALIGDEKMLDKSKAVVFK